MIYLIWSFEHDGFWCRESGYCNNVDKAARYTLEEALNRATPGNHFGQIKEAIVPFEDAAAIFRLKQPQRPYGANMPGPHIWREAAK